MNDGQWLITISHFRPLEVNVSLKESRHDVAQINEENVKKDIKLSLRGPTKIRTSECIPQSGQPSLHTHTKSKKVQ